MRADIPLPAAPIGKIKMFGPSGPKYQVSETVCQREDGDWMVEVTMVETGEKAEYRLTHLLANPEVT